MEFSKSPLTGGIFFCMNLLVAAANYKSSTKIIREEHLLPERQSARQVAAHRCVSRRVSERTRDRRQE
jgi:hypothetical protein